MPSLTIPVPAANDFAPVTDAPDVPTPPPLPPAPAAHDAPLADRALRREAELGYLVPSGRYWEQIARFAPAELAALDALWLAAGALAMAEAQAGGPP